MEDLKRKEKEEKNRKEELKNKKGQEMRAAAVSKMCSKLRDGLSNFCVRSEITSGGCLFLLFGCRLMAKVRKVKENWYNIHNF